MWNLLHSYFMFKSCKIIVIFYLFQSYFDSVELEMFLICVTLAHNLKFKMCSFENIPTLLRNVLIIVKKSF